jgi:hypothetical protein
MTTLKMAFNWSELRRMVKVYDNEGALVAAICPDETINGIRIVSKNIGELEFEDDVRSDTSEPAINVVFRTPTSTMTKPSLLTVDSPKIDGPPDPPITPPPKRTKALSDSQMNLIGLRAIPAILLMVVAVAIWNLLGH